MHEEKRMHFFDMLKNTSWFSVVTWRLENRVFFSERQKSVFRHHMATTLAQLRNDRARVPTEWTGSGTSRSRATGELFFRKSSTFPFRVTRRWKETRQLYYENLLENQPTKFALEKIRLGRNWSPVEWVRTSARRKLLFTGAFFFSKRVPKVNFHHWSFKVEEFLLSTTYDVVWLLAWNR